MILSLTLALAAPQTTWFVDSTATPPGNGTGSSPYTRVDFAVAQPTTVDGDTVFVVGGTYPDEAIDLDGKSLTLRTPGAVLRGRSSDAAILSNAGGGSTTVEGFTFERGRGQFVPALSLPEVGGAIYAVDTDLVVRRCTFDDCSAFRGGVAYLDSTGAPSGVTFEDCLVRPGCTAEDSGGAIYSRNVELTVEDSTLRAFAQFADGGIVYADHIGGGSVTVRRCDLDGGAREDGGAIYVFGGSVLLEDSTIEGFSTEDFTGGGLAVESVGLEVNRCVFENCRAIRGGAVAIGAANPARFADTRFVNNATVSTITMSPGSGGAILTASLIEVERCIFERNRSRHHPDCHGGAISGPARVRFSTFVDNEAISRASALSDTTSLATTDVETSIVVSFVPQPVPLIEAGAEVDFSLVDGGFMGQGNVDGDPAFWGLSDFQPLPNSAAIDLAPPFYGVDPDGTPRDAGALRFDRDHCGTGCDGVIGIPSCVAAPNSTFFRSEIRGVGTLVVARNRVVLNVDRLPPGSLGYFIASQTSAFVPGAGGSSGNLCIGGSALRFSNQILQPTPFDSNVSFRPMLNDLPGGGAVFPGETWFFQYWHRDAVAGVATSNFSPALQLGF
ncbi:MAG: right-handed parallel beta-helix repeat-containing protein [Planctomycetota bacterium]